MKSPQIAKSQHQFKKLKGTIHIDESFIKEIHKGNFKDSNDPRKKHLEENSKDLNCWIEMAIDSNNNIYLKATNTKDYRKNEFKKI